MDLETLRVFGISNGISSFTPRNQLVINWLEGDVLSENPRVSQDVEIFLHAEIPFKW